MTFAGFFDGAAPWPLRRRPISARFALHTSTREAPAVDLALKLNVLAVCAVFVFVGAILLGAF